MFFKVDLETHLGKLAARLVLAFGCSDRERGRPDAKLGEVELEPPERDLLLRIYTADRRWTESGHDQRTFLLLHHGGMRRSVDHPGWEESWEIPTSQAIDDLEEFGLLRVEPAAGLNRTFVLSTTGRRAARILDRPSERPPDPPARGSRDPEAHPNVPTAIVSWAHGDTAWQETVLGLVFALRANGVNADVDLFHGHDGDVEWSTYGPRAIETSDFVLVAVSAAWKQRFDGTNMPTSGAGAAAEADAILGLFDQSNQAAFRSKVKILILPGASENDIPLQLRGSAQRFRIAELTGKGLETLLRVIHDRPAFPAPTVGPIPLLPPTFVDHAMSASPSQPPPDSAVRAPREERTRPAIHASTAALLRHLQAHGAQTAPELEHALGDVDQIGPDEITEWTTWASGTGLIVLAPGRPTDPRWEISPAGQQLIGPSRGL